MGEIMDLFNNTIGELYLVKIIYLSLNLGILILSLMALFNNAIDWIWNIVEYYNRTRWFELTYPKDGDKIVKVVYDLYVIGLPSGEIFYVDTKMLKRLKRKELILWDNKVDSYVFHDSDLEKVVELTSPIIIYESTRK